jgi:DNA sulfur modification protein DndC
VVDKHELEDALPRLYREATGEDYPGRPLDDYQTLGERDMRELEELSEGDRLHYELTRELLSLTQQQRTSARRAGLYENLEKAFRRHFYDDREDALARAHVMADERKHRDRQHRDRQSGQVTEAADELELKG